MLAYAREHFHVNSTQNLTEEQLAEAQNNAIKGILLDGLWQSVAGGASGLATSGASVTAQTAANTVTGARSLLGANGNR